MRKQAFTDGKIIHILQEDKDYHTNGSEEIYGQKRNCSQQAYEGCLSLSDSGISDSSLVCSLMCTNLVSSRCHLFHLQLCDLPCHVHTSSRIQSRMKGVMVLL